MEHITGTTLYNLIKQNLRGTFCAACCVGPKLFYWAVSQQNGVIICTFDLINTCIKIQLVCVWVVRLWPMGSLDST